MPWVRATLHGQNVYARAREDGALIETGGRVEVCYKTNATRIYRARASNIVVGDRTVLPDDACAPGSAPKLRAAAAVPGSTGARATGGRAVKAREQGGAAASEPHPTRGTDGTVIAYADGACSGNPGPAGLGVVMLDGGERIEVSESLGIGTNNVAELMAIERVLELVKQPDRPISIYTDSGYAIGVLSKGWKAKANVELVERIRRELSRRAAVRFVHVRGHAGVPLNERADELAREAVRTGRTHTTRRRSDPPPGTQRKEG